MRPKERLHYALGLIAYAMSGIDGAIQKAERQKFHDIVAAELRYHHYDFNVSDIIYQVMDRDKTDPLTAYDWALREIELNSHYLDPKTKELYLRIAEKIAKAFPPVTEEESNLLERFRNDIAPFKGDPVYYS